MHRPGRIRARLAALVLTVSAALGAMAVVGATPVDAQPVDRCGSAGTEWVPDRGSGFDFNRACHVHDLCYGLKPYGTGSEGRLGCDREFLMNMRASCHISQGPMVGYTPCLALADLYYGGVRFGGVVPFDRAEPPTGTVTVGPLEPVRDEAPTGGGGGGAVGGGGWGFIGGGGGTPSGTVTVGEPEPVETQAE